MQNLTIPIYLFYVPLGSKKKRDQGWTIHIILLLQIKKTLDKKNIRCLSYLYYNQLKTIRNPQVLFPLYKTLLLSQQAFLVLFSTL